MIYIIIEKRREVLNMEERRKHPRHECALETGYNAKKIFSRTNYTICKDISEGGMRLPVSGPIKNNSLLDLRIGLEHGTPAFTATARVIWIKKNKRPAPLGFEAGLEFTDELWDPVKSYLAKL